VDNFMSSITKPAFIAVKPPACPVCGKPSYSRGGVHPQCAVARADKARKPKPAKPAAKKTAERSQWSKRCPRCDRQIPVRRYACDCGHRFQPSAGG
jgi:hypothetical protein